MVRPHVPDLLEVLEVVFLPITFDICGLFGFLDLFFHCDRQISVRVAELFAVLFEKLDLEHFKVVLVVNSHPRGFVELLVRADLIVLDLFRHLVDCVALFELADQ